MTDSIVFRNNKAGNCRNKMTSCGDLNKVRMGVKGLDKYCGDEGNPRCLTWAGWKMAKKVWRQWKRAGVNAPMRKGWKTKKSVELKLIVFKVESYPAVYSLGAYFEISIARQRTQSQGEELTRTVQEKRQEKRQVNKWSEKKRIRRNKEG
jgi:hypothetical protein